MLGMLFGGLGTLMFNPLFWQVVLVWLFVFNGADIITGVINAINGL